MTEPTLLADRALLRVEGDDPRGFLQGLLTNDLTRLSPVAPLWAGLLTPQGKALFDLILWADGDAVLVDCEVVVAEAVARRLAMYRLRRAIAVAPAAGSVHWSATGTAGVADPRLAALGRRWIAREGAAEGDAGGRWRAHRLGLGVAEGVAEIGSGDSLWLECNADLLHGVSFAKGCYVGQENTARMHHRAKVNRRLAVAPLAADDGAARVRYADLGWQVGPRRIGEWGDALRPAWLTIASGDDPA